MPMSRFGTYRESERYQSVELSDLNDFRRNVDLSDLGDVLQRSLLC
jgi:hypothetical protein